MRKTRRLIVAFLTAVLLVAFAVGTGIAQNAVTTDFSGEWTVVRSQDNTENPWVGDFFGLPLNADGVARAETWDASLLSLPEYQCRPHGWAYIYRGPTQLRISKDVDPYSREIVAYQPEWHQSTNMPVYLDGRDAPPAEAAHSWGGFSTAKWEGDMLRIETSHLKEDYIRRDGAMATDEKTSYSGIMHVGGSMPATANPVLYGGWQCTVATARGWRFMICRCIRISLVRFFVPQN